MVEVSGVSFKSETIAGEMLDRGAWLTCICVLKMLIIRLRLLKAVI